MQNNVSGIRAANYLRLSGFNIISHQKPVCDNFYINNYVYLTPLQSL